MAEIILPKISLGAWAWGNDGTFGNGIDATELKPIFEAALLFAPRLGKLGKDMRSAHREKTGEAVCAALERRGAFLSRMA